MGDQLGHIKLNILKGKRLKTSRGKHKHVLWYCFKKKEKNNLESCLDTETRVKFNRV